MFLVGFLTGVLAALAATGLGVLIVSMKERPSEVLPLEPVVTRIKSAARSKTPAKRKPVANDDLQAWKAERNSP